MPDPSMKRVKIPLDTGRSSIDDKIGSGEKIQEHGGVEIGVRGVALKPGNFANSTIEVT